MSAFVKSLPVVLGALVLLAAITLLGYTGHWTAVEVLGPMGLMLGVVVGHGGWVIGSPNQDTQLLPHAVIAAGLVGSATALNLHNIFTNSQALGIFSPIVGAIIVGGGIIVGTTVPAPPPPVPPIVGNSGSPLP